MPIKQSPATNQPVDNGVDSLESLALIEVSHVGQRSEPAC